MKRDLLKVYNGRLEALESLVCIHAPDTTRAVAGDLDLLKEKLGSRTVAKLFETSACVGYATHSHSERKHYF
jgi:hypothetical protein